jgi:hypothetical protein
MPPAKFDTNHSRLNLATSGENWITVPLAWGWRKERNWKLTFSRRITREFAEFADKTRCQVMPSFWLLAIPVPRPWRVLPLGRWALKR